MDPLFGAHSELIGQLARDTDAVGIRRALAGLPRLLGKAVALAWQVSPSSVALLAVVELCVGSMAATGLLATNSALLQLLQPPINHQRVEAAVPGIILAASTAAAAGGLRILEGYLLSRIGPGMDMRASQLLLRSAVSSELAVVDDAEFHNSMALARSGSRSLQNVFTQTVAMARSALSVAAVSLALGSLHPLLFCLACASAVPKGLSAVVSARGRYRSAVRWIENTRKLDLLAYYMMDRESAEEIRVHQVGDYLVDGYTRLSHRALREQRRLASRAALASVAGGSLSALLTALTYVALGTLVWSGRTPLASAGAALLAIPSLTREVAGFVAAVNAVFEQALPVTEWERACARVPATQPPPELPRLHDNPREIRARGVCFRYTGAAHDTLADIDITVARGQVTALVGENGSGKSTLAKLLAGLYLPSRGSLTWDGIPVEQLERPSVLRQVSLLAQGFVTWPFTARANVAMGRPQEPWNEDRIEHALRGSGSWKSVSGLRDGLDTLLALNFKRGVQLSGGQWQRIGLARVAYRNAPFVILDEPTAALDPEAEIEVFKEVAKRAEAGNAVLLVTHRLASTRLAHHIHVMKDGRIVESGSHDELLKLDGSYARMYRLQSEQFDRV
ncbi:ABC transporter ATP-binding protein [Kitasatospora sp. NPDC059747]|uniref:ABC transporter ATP-binding protein n=1 Tax=Kitasatospora sp. NPDC059747 TaxID=3346930 RepID=UPI0036694E41